jgi:hypothetical protein
MCIVDNAIYVLFDFHSVRDFLHACTKCMKIGTIVFLQYAKLRKNIIFLHHLSILEL